MEPSLVASPPSRLSRVPVGPRYVNLYDVGCCALVVDNELVAQPQAFKQRLRLRYQRPRLVAGDRAAWNPGDQLAAGERDFDRTRPAPPKPFVEADISRQHV